MKTYKISVDGETADRIGVIGMEKMGFALLDYTCPYKNSSRKEGAVRIRVKGPSHGHAFCDYICTTTSTSAFKVVRTPDWEY